MQISLTRKVKHKQIMVVYSYKILDFLTINDWTDFLAVLLYCTKNQLVIYIYRVDYGSSVSQSFQNHVSY